MPIRLIEIPLTRNIDPNDLTLSTMRKEQLPGSLAFYQERNTSTTELEGLLDNNWQLIGGPATFVTSSGIYLVLVMWQPRRL